MIYLIKALKEDNNILYICSTKDTEVVLKEIESLDYSYISGDDGVISYSNDPFLMTQININ